VQSHRDGVPGGHKSEAVRKAAAAIWGSAVPPQALPPQQVFWKVAEKAAELYPDLTISKSHALRALGLKK
jgi:hypothetical protein